MPVFRLGNIEIRDIARREQQRAVMERRWGNPYPQFDRLEQRYRYFCWRADHFVCLVFRIPDRKSSNDSGFSRVDLGSHECRVQQGMGSDKS